MSEVNVNFGSVRNPLLKPVAVHQNDIDDEFPTVLDEFTVTEFIAGNCAYLAAAIHEITGWDIFEEYELKDDFTFDEYDNIHCWVRNINGNAVDILGEHKGNWAATRLTQSHIKRVIVDANSVKYPFYKNELTSPTKKGSELSWARDIINKYPAYFGIDLEIHKKQNVDSKYCK